MKPHVLYNTITIETWFITNFAVIIRPHFEIPVCASRPQRDDEIAHSTGARQIRQKPADAHANFRRDRLASCARCRPCDSHRRSDCSSQLFSINQNYSHVVLTNHDLCKLACGVLSAVPHVHIKSTASSIRLIACLHLVLRIDSDFDPVDIDRSASAGSAFLRFPSTITVLHAYVYRNLRDALFGSRGGLPLNVLVYGRLPPICII